QLAISSISCGLPLDEAQEECTRMLGIVRGLRNKGPIATVQGPLQYVRALRGLTERVTCFSGADFDEASFEASLSDGDVPLAATYYALCKMQAALFTGDVPGALAAAERASALVGAIGTQFSAAEVRLYTTLAHLAAEAEAKDDEARARHLAEAERLAEPIEHWAEACPENFRHMHALVGAELARARGDDLEAMRLYDQAIAAAREGRYIHAEGLASELCARFHRGRGLTTIASAYARPGGRPGAALRRAPGARRQRAVRVERPARPARRHHRGQAGPGDLVGDHAGPAGGRASAHRGRAGRRPGRAVLLGRGRAAGPGGARGGRRLPGGGRRAPGVRRGRADPLVGHPLRGAHPRAAHPRRAGGQAGVLVGSGAGARPAAQHPLHAAGPADLAGRPALPGERPHAGRVH